MKDGQRRYDDIDGYIASLTPLEQAQLAEAEAALDADLAAVRHDWAMVSADWIAMARRMGLILHPIPPPSPDLRGWLKRALRSRPFRRLLRRLVRM